MSVNGMFSGAQESRSERHSAEMFFQHDPMFFDAVVNAKNEKKYGSIKYTEMSYEDKFDDFRFFSSAESGNDGPVMSSLDGDSGNSSDSDFLNSQSGHFGFNGLSAFGGYDFSNLSDDGEPVFDDNAEADSFDFFEEFGEKKPSSEVRADAFDFAFEENNIEEEISSEEDFSPEEETLYNFFSEDDYLFDVDEEDATTVAPLFTEEFELSDESDFVMEVQENNEYVDESLFEGQNDDYYESENEESENDEEDEDSFSNNVYRGRSAKNILIAVLIAALFLGFVTIAVVTTLNSFLGNGEIYNGVLINGKNLGGMTKEQAEEYIDTMYVKPVEDAQITIVAGNSKKNYSLGEFVQCPDAEELSLDAYNVARTGNLFSRVKAIRSLEENNVSLGVSYIIVDDIEEKLSEIAESASDISFSDPVNPTYVINTDSISFTSGKYGTKIDGAKFSDELIEKITLFQNEIVSLGANGSATLDDIVIEIGTTDSPFELLNPSKIYNEVYTSPQEAFYYKDSTGKVCVSQHVSGRKVNADELNELVERINSGEAISYAEIKFSEEVPQNSTQKLKDALYESMVTKLTSENKSDIYSYSDYAGKYEREQNMKKAASAFDAVELLPNEEFSLLKLIGSEQYIEAYENTVNGGRKIIGGGISQVASAIYTASLKSDMTVVKHTNNKYYPRYCEKAGFDAYIEPSSGVDLTVRNTSGAPVKVVVYFENGEICVEVYGRKMDKTITLKSNPLEKTSSPEGARFNYDISIDKGGIQTSLKDVSYIKYGEPNPTPSETPGVDDTETPFETDMPVQTDDPFATVDPGETFDPDVTYVPGETATPPFDETEDPYWTVAPTETLPPPTETDYPSDTFAPTDSSDSPYTENPTGSELPPETNDPITSEPSESPVVSEDPYASESPMTSESPAVSETPVASETPSPTESFDPSANATESPSPEPPEVSTPIPVTQP